jgi:hypothetical protein
MQDLTPNCTGGILWKNQCEADPFGYIKLAGMPQHIVQCDINRESCVFAEEDYQ